MTGLSPGYASPRIDDSSTTIVNTVAGSTAESSEPDLLRAGFRYALALTSHHQDAEDLVQQGCLRLYNKYGGIRHLPLLFTTIRNLFFDQRQRESKLRMVSIDDLDEGDMQPSGYFEVPTNMARLDIARVLVSLRANEREVLFFHYFHGYTAAEIAGLTDQPRGTVLSLLQRSRRKLGVLLAKAPPETLEGAL